jgi:hypothetical protein
MALNFELHKLTVSIWNVGELTQQWKESVIVLFIKWEAKLEVISKESLFCQLHTKFYPEN